MMFKNFLIVCKNNKDDTTIHVHKRTYDTIVQNTIIHLYIIRICILFLINKIIYYRNVKKCNVIERKKKEKKPSTEIL